MSMLSLSQLQSLISIPFSSPASLTGWLWISKSVVDKIIPSQVQQKLLNKIIQYFYPADPKFSLIIKESIGYNSNEFYDASELFLRTKITSSVKRLQVVKLPKEKGLVFTMDQNQEIVDIYEGIKLTWSYITQEKEKDSRQKEETQFFELRFDEKHKEKIMNSYLPYVLKKYNSIKRKKKVLKLYTRYGSKSPWSSVNLSHPSTFDTLAMDHKLKTEIIEDLKRFLKRREFYKRVGKAWKRGYLLYGPPGTGKSSLIAAMANYLKFDVYDLELANVLNNAELRRLLVTTANRSILVIEDIDCSVEMQNREAEKQPQESTDKSSDKSPPLKSDLTLSGLLNFIDGLWSSCGDERIIIFTTNHKDRIDPALLRPGRMDKHIHMSYCTAEGFSILASNYLGIRNNDEKSELYLEIQELIEKCNVTPAEVAEELMKSDDADIALGELLEFLKRKRLEQDEGKKDKDEKN